MPRETGVTRIPVEVQMDSMTSSKVFEPRQRAGETEKSRVNLGMAVGVVGPGRVELLVQQGFWSNRSDPVRAAVRSQLALQADTLKQTVARHTLTVGRQHYRRADSEGAVATGQRLQLPAVGPVRSAGDVTPALARAAIDCVTVLGAFQASAVRVPSFDPCAINEKSCRARASAGLDTTA